MRDSAWKKVNQLKDQLEKEEERYRCRVWTLFAAVKSRQLKEQLKKDPEKEDRRKLVQEVFDRVDEELAKKPITASWISLRGPLQDVVAVYDKDEKMDDLVDKGKKLIKKVDDRMAGKKP
jgi:hypothetical protein